MDLIRHMCGQDLERGAGPQGAYFVLVFASEDAERGDYEEVQVCPQCGEDLCDTDCTDLGGVPLYINNQSKWSIERRRARGWST